MSEGLETICHSLRSNPQNFDDISFTLDGKNLKVSKNNLHPQSSKWQETFLCFQEKVTTCIEDFSKKNRTKPCIRARPKWGNLVPPKCVMTICSVLQSMLWKMKFHVLGKLAEWASQKSEQHTEDFSKEHQLFWEKWKNHLFTCIHNFCV